MVHLDDSSIAFTLSLSLSSSPSLSLSSALWPSSSNPTGTTTSKRVRLVTCRRQKSTHFDLGLDLSSQMHLKQCRYGNQSTARFDGELASLHPASEKQTRERKSTRVEESAFETSHHFRFVAPPRMLWSYSHTHTHTMGVNECKNGVECR